jgi:hypothetical protein
MLTNKIMKEKLHILRFEFANKTPKVIPGNIEEQIKERINRRVPQDIIEAANRTSTRIKVSTDQPNTSSFSVSSNDDNLKEAIESYIIEEFGSLEWQYSPS